ncbi:GNAT family N-acetyltransferase [Streptomyces sp. W16]|uniref:GNAT family N-acetyltransferase n=1 Tax=Streptomyces sp. W16 TaxID=3076631 RepID=UPI00295BAD87|nr:GNAT family N-acetyltransferase [Streptomyces sp. W16]MDV9178122.1 GNAT family N-acetyltransferase [Streptomyces sp. W16]
MDVNEENGLRIASCDMEEGLDRVRSGSLPDADILRIARPEPSARNALERAGFVVKPSWVTWMAHTRESEEEFLAGLSGNERGNMRKGQRFVRAQGISLKVFPVLEDRALEEFLTLYERQIAGMRYGISYGRRWQARMLADRDTYFAVHAYRGDTLVGGCVCQVLDAKSTMRIRFNSADPAERHGRLMRVMYLAAFQEARDRGQRRVSLGSDPSLYGHIAKPGLFTFKSRLGFLPVPAQWLDPRDGADEADLVLRLDALEDPSLLLAYDGPPEAGVPWDTPGRLRMEVLAGAEDVDVTQYRAPFLAGHRIRVVR